MIDVDGRRRDVHLKGSGRTPFARGGDGKAAVGPMLREYLVGEAMHGLGIPTTRALAVVATGEPVQRETVLPGAVLCRVAASHLRVGTFQYAAASGDRDVLRALADHAIARHHPEAADAANPYLELYRRVVEAQAELVARWMLVGFVHGVMNTDNTTISGETIDYGPCAFMDAFDPATVFSSIDQRGRYAYGNQPAIAQWNLARLGETLLPLIDENADAAVEAATEVVDGFAEAYSRPLGPGHGGQARPGRPGPGARERPAGADARPARRLHALLPGARGGDGAVAVRRARAVRRVGRAACGGAAAEGAAEAMDRVNPVYIPRNHRVEEALAAATAGDTGAVPCGWSTPSPGRSTSVPGLEDLVGPAPRGCAPHVTYCGT